MNLNQIKALLRKDYLVRIRKPWMTALQYIWPCAIFIALYTLRNRFQSTEIQSCQYATRQLPTKGEFLPFFQSYICTIGNECLNTTNYEEITTFNEAPLTPALNIIQTFLNEKKLFNAIVDLPATMNFLGSITTIATHEKFSVLEENINQIQNNIKDYSLLIGDNFDIKKLWSDDETFSKGGNILCGKPFPRSNNIRFVENVFYAEDYNGPDKAELNVMPTNYCKQLYLDVTNTNHGKITWSEIKPIIHGKILYGPNTDKIKEIMTYTNETFQGINKLKIFIGGLDTIIVMLRTNDTFQGKLKELLDLAKSPLIQGIISAFGIDTQMIDAIFQALLYDETVATVIKTISNILECFTVDRFIPVKNENELEQLAHKLNEDKLFYAGIYFDQFNENDKKEYKYKLRMEIDDTPITIENKNRFWFPGPNDDFELEMRYHRGFIQIQNAIDQGIIKSEKKTKDTLVQRELDRTSTTTSTTPKTSPIETMYDEDLDWDYDNDRNESDSNDNIKSNRNDMNRSEQLINDENDNDEIITTTENSNDYIEKNSTNSPLLDIIYENFGSNINLTDDDLNQFVSEDGVRLEDFLNFNDDDEEQVITTPLATMMRTPTTTENMKNKEFIDIKNRTKRAPQFDGLLSMLFGGSSSDTKTTEELYIESGNFNIDQYRMYTKEFPYPSYRKDNFKKGLYLAQSIQLAFFFALIVQVAGSVRQRIWMKESGNSMLMQAMGLKKSSENIAWIMTTIIELAIIFLLCLIILYTGGILETTSKLFLYFYLMIFGCCVVSFCYMTSTFFTAASTGSVSAVILFLITFMPYIIIIALGASLSFGAKFLANLSISTAFCYAWHFIMRTELQQKELTFSNAFSDSLNTNDLKFGIFMLILDTILYAIIGYVYERVMNDEYKYHKVNTKDMDSSIGAAMNNVTKSYGELSPAIKNVSMVFRRDFITCLLGRNGAGKSTIIKLLTGQILPTNGSVYLPQNLDRITGNESKEKIGLCPQNNILIPNLTAKEHLQLYARIKIPTDFQSEIERIMNCLNYDKYKNFKSENLSGGYKRRLNIAIAFLGSPNLVILDEPCSGVDTRARKNIWELIEQLRKGRAVVLATHYLDEAEHLSDNILVLNNGSVVAEHTADTLKDNFSKSFNLHIDLFDAVDKMKTIEIIKNILKEHSPNYNVLCNGDEADNVFKVSIPYYITNYNYINYGVLIKSIEDLKDQKHIKNLHVIGNNLDVIFNDLNEIKENEIIIPMQNGSKDNNYEYADEYNDEISQFDIIKNLFWKRFLHFKRNYKLLICVLILPVIFEIIAMGFMKIRPQGDHDNPLKLSKNLYEGNQEFYSIENEDNTTRNIFNNFQKHCTENCNYFNSSENVYRWLLHTNNDYLDNRYGGISINKTNEIIWFNNNGYHVMPAFLNELNTKMFKSELDNDDWNIITINHPLQLGRSELSTSSILQQVADAGISLIILVAFSLVVAGSSIYLVNERVTGEKLQQQLCGVSFKIYWGVSFLWDLIIYCDALLLAVIVFQLFGIPIYTAKDNFSGIILLIFLFGFATIPMVHIVEKIFKDSSLANMYIFCMNIILALSTITIIVLFDVLGDSYEIEQIRNTLNRIFLIFPQHALADGLIEICKNHVLAEVFERYYINTYKSPISSNLLLPHFLALFILGIVFMSLNYIYEKRCINLNSLKSLMWKTDKCDDLNSISITEKSNSSNGVHNKDKYDYNGPIVVAANDNILNVIQLTKRYDRKQYALHNVTFSLKRGECFGLLGANGAGKSTIFSILSGQLLQTSGTIEFCNKNNKNDDKKKSLISYCPQNNALDDLLTVNEIIIFYGRLRNIKNLKQLTTHTLKAFHLEQYKNILVKNLSGGNRRKLSVAITCFGNTDIILMDEPTSDMDPMTRSLVYKTINELIEHKRSIILTSHAITEIDRVCHRIGVLHDGTMLSIGTPNELQTLYGNRYLVTVFYDNVEALSIERDIKKDIPEIENLITHRHCLQFTIQIKSTKFNIINSEQLHDDSGGINLSDIFNKLHNLTINRNINYTITECQLDQAFEKSMESQNESTYINSGFTQTETIT